MRERDFPPFTRFHPPSTMFLPCFWCLIRSIMYRYIIPLYSSFSCALVAAHSSNPNYMITPSVLSPDPQSLSTLYPTSTASIKNLASHQATPLFNVDATNLNRVTPTLSPQDVVIFNFPQTPPETRTNRKIQYQRTLLSSFLISSANILNPEGGVIVTLARGQSGVRTVDALRPHQADHWNLVEAAANAGFLVVQSWRYFNLGWMNLGCGGGGGEFDTKGANCFLCVREGWEGGEVKQLVNPEFTFDVSFWAEDGVWKEESFRELLGE